MKQPAELARWRRIAALLDELLELPEAERAAQLAVLCQDDAELRSEVEALLAIEGRQGLLDAPAGEYLATLLQEAEVGQQAGRERPTGRSSSTSGNSRSSPSFDVRLLPGTLLAGRYRIVNRLGRGGMGEVFRADDLKLGQAVALKFLSAELAGSDDFKARFLTEIKLARQVAHPNVGRVYDVGEADGLLFLSMEFVEGEDLASLLKRIGRLPREKAVQISQQLCAGLAAAHAEGILHRDLKPANVMLDERGRVRITDFGLAGLAEELEGTEVLAGTPAYMSPEQLTGQRISIRSDLYALGLLLYELYTGKRAFEGGSWAEARRARESAPPPPSSHVSAIDPAVERVILRCLEEDPQERPSSALEVAGALPGGDPLAAALAAGDTPSPEMVAAAGLTGRLRSTTAGILLAVIAILLGSVAYLAPGASYVGVAPMEKPVAALVDGVREMLAGLGYEEPPADHAYSFSRDLDYIGYLKAADSSPSRWLPLASEWQVALRFEYRQSPRLLEPLGWTARVTENDPPPGAGDISVFTDLGGRLRALRVVPPPVARPGQSPLFDDWPALFAAAGLDFGAFQPATPTRQPLAFSEVRAAWLGTLPELRLPVRIEAAAVGAKPTYFECILPSSPHWIEPGSEGGPVPAPADAAGLFRILWTVFLLTSLLLPLILALRNMRSGRGAYRDASRFAAAVFTLRLLWWVFAGHHIAGLSEELSLLGQAVARSLFVAAMAWLFYMAIEPHARRLWPGTLVSWSRLLAGRLRDPLVGQHLLVGVLGGLAVALAGGVLYFLIPQWLGWPNPPNLPGYPFWPFFAPRTDPLLGTRPALAAVASSLMGALWMSFAVLTVLIGLFALIRRKWFAGALSVLLLGPLMFPAQLSDYSWLGVTIGILMMTAGVWFVVRYGLLSVVVTMFVTCLVFVFPITLDPDVPYFGTSLFALLVVAALAGFGAWASAGGTGHAAAPARPA